MIDKLFCYGTLMIPAIFSATSGQRAQWEPAVLAGYQRYQMRDQPYPGIVRRSGAVVSGCLYRGVVSKALDKLDSYEGEWYIRRLVKVHCSHNKVVTAWCYEVRAMHKNKVGQGDWDLKDFVQQHLAPTLAQLSVRQTFINKSRNHSISKKAVTSARRLFG